jgi:hypothetical protein
MSCRGFNFVLEDALGGGVNASLFLDGHGKGLSFLILTMPIKAPAPLVGGHRCSSVGLGC